MSDIAQPKRFVAVYAGSPAGQRYEMWREELCRGFCRMDVEPSRHDRIDCRTVYTTISSVTLARPTGVSGRFMRTREVLSDGYDDLLLFSAVRGPVQVTQGDQTIDLAQGQMCLAEMNEFCAVALHDGNEFTAVRIPRTSVLQMAPRAEDKLCLPLGEDAALRTMIDQYTKLCIDVAPSLDAVGQQRAAQHLTDLTGLLLGATDDAEIAAKPGYSDSRFDLIKSNVLKELHRHDLTVDLVARAHGLIRDKRSAFLLIQVRHLRNLCLSKGSRWHTGFSMTPVLDIEKLPRSPILRDLAICLTSTANFAGVSEILQAQYAIGSRLGRRAIRTFRPIDPHREG